MNLKTGHYTLFKKKLILRRKSIKDIEKLFLTREGESFDLSVKGLELLLEKYLADMKAGLHQKPSSLKMIPTFIEPTKRIPRNKPVVAIDAGGTNFRSALVCFNQNTNPDIQSATSNPMPGTNKEVSSQLFFSQMAHYLKPVISESAAVGFCFSYPVQILPNKDGILLQFSKEIRAPEVVGKAIGEYLLTALKDEGFNQTKKIIILNDTVATLLAGMFSTTGRHYDNYLAFILGTGTNTAYIEKNRHLIDQSAGEIGRQIINVESGAFTGIPLTQVDQDFLNSTREPDNYYIEKMMSGAYFAPLTLLYLKEAAALNLFSDNTIKRIEQIEELSGIDLTHFLTNPARSTSILTQMFQTMSISDKENLFDIINFLLQRAAFYSALTISAPIILSKNPKPYNSCFITCDGSFIEKIFSLPERIDMYLSQILTQKHGIYYHMKHVDNASLVGAAIAGLTN